LALSKDGKYIATGSHDRSVGIWLKQESKIIKKIDGFDGAVVSVDFSNNNEYLVVGSEDKKVKVFDTKEWKL
jgi:WD40 repeat protein